jgi:DNA-binding CsgD family transcriptional regulator/PAS domain-containing protein
VHRHLGNWVGRVESGGIVTPAALPRPAEGTSHEPWVEAWAGAVRASQLAMGLLDVASMRFLAVSTPAATLLGTTPEAALELDYLSMIEEEQEARTVHQLLRSGALDSVQARRRVRRVDGRCIDLLIRGRTIRHPAGPHLGLWIVTEVVGDEDHAVTADVLAGLPDRLVSLEPVLVHPAFGALDHRWRIAQLSTDVDDVLGRPPEDLVGSSIIDMTHPADVADLLSTFARATIGRHAGGRVRMRHRYRDWQAVSLLVVVLAEASASFGFVIGADPEPETSTERKRVTELEHRLLHIAEEVQAAGVERVLGPVADGVRVPSLSDLTARQWEVISRLARGERVATIANEMYLSQSTVRNHLSAAFRKVGVNSQRGLLALLQRD